MTVSPPCICFSYPLAMQTYKSVRYVLPDLFALSILSISCLGLFSSCYDSCEPQRVDVKRLPMHVTLHQGFGPKRLRVDKVLKYANC
jgi:hypothetical protein